MLLDLCRRVFILTLVWLIPQVGLAATYLPKDSRLQSAIKDIKSLELDINGNGKPDYYREFDDTGRLRFIRYDYNEDGKPEFQVELDVNGFKKEELVDRNYDGKIDYKVICKQKECIKYLDQKFDGNFIIDGKINPERYSLDGKPIDEYRIFINYKKILNRK